MTPITQTTAEEVRKFIYERVLGHPSFAAVIAVSVEQYPSEYSATVWVGQEPDQEMRKYAYELETELSRLGVPSSILVRTDRELPFGGTYRLRTKKGECTYRNYKIDARGDEDMVYLFALYRGKQTYRFRMSISGTLASMLRARNRLNEDRILEVYLDRIRQQVDSSDLEPDEVHSIMFDSRDLALLVRA